MKRARRSSAWIVTLLFAPLIFTYAVLLNTAHAKRWLPPEVVDDSNRSDNIFQITASQERYGHLYIAWGDWDTSGTYNIYGKYRFPSLSWSSSYPYTSFTDELLGGAYPNMASSIDSGFSPLTFVVYNATGQGVVVYPHGIPGGSDIIDTSTLLGTAIAGGQDYFYVVYKDSPHPYQLYLRKYCLLPVWICDPGWSDRVVITSTASWIENWDVAAGERDDSGWQTAYAAWTERPTGGPADLVKYARYTEDGGWETPYLVDSMDSASVVKIAVSPQDDLPPHIHIVWQGQQTEGDDTEIFAKSRRGTWTTVENISDDTFESSSPSFVLGDDLTLHVVWEKNGGADGVVCYRKWDHSWQPTIELTSGAVSDRGCNPYITARNPSYGGSGVSDLYVLYAGGAGALGSPLMLRRFGDLSAHTPVGDDVEVVLGDHTITFGEVNMSGVTTIVERSEGSDLPSDLMQGCDPPHYFEITTTASVGFDWIEICLAYDDSSCDDSDPDFRLYHRSGDTWYDVTTFINTEANIICGRVMGLSEFVLARPGPPLCKGDLDADHDVDGVDLSGCVENKPDLNGDGKFDEQDVKVFANAFGETRCSLVCDDNDLCTIDTYDPQTGSCVFTPKCNDLNFCTDDICNSSTGECKYVPNGLVCQACCLRTRQCVEAPPKYCESILNGTPQGPGSTCENTICIFK